MQERVLIIEDNHTVARMIAVGIGNRFGIPVDVVGSYSDAKSVLQDNSQYLLALCDLNLPDSQNCEALDLVLSYHIPAIVMTGISDNQVRKDVIAKSIVDYVPKDHPEDIDYIIERVGEIIRNRRVKILVVDDSALARSIMVKLLRIQQFIVFEADNGQAALTTVEHNPDIKVVLTDYNMPVMNGLELTIQLRRKYRRESLAIIAISSESDTAISSHLLKLGASDFIHKPFIKEEFDCRVNNTVRSLENLEKMLNLANRDYLTGLFNRRHFFASFDEYQKEVRSNPQPFSTAMFDLDDFKKINDTYGHDAGDLALTTFSAILLKHIRGADIAARFGGEEFCVLLKNAEPEDAFRIFDLIRSDLEKTVITTPGGRHSFKCTSSAGMASEQGLSASDMLALADKRLYSAKLRGKNQICRTE